MPTELVPELVPQLQQLAEVADLFGLPFFTDVKTGTNYGDLSKWEV